MQRVKDDGIWSLFCPNECKGLPELWGEDFERMYTHYERNKQYRKQIKARELWSAILTSQIETGNPYLLYKDACNRKSNQQNLGTIKSSNLCTEIVEYTSPEETAVCNLASIALPKFVSKNNNDYDYKKLYETAKLATKNLDRVIDINFYPTNKTDTSNNLHRPIGLGIQGLSDVFFKMSIAHDGKEAAEINLSLIHI